MWTKATGFWASHAEDTLCKLCGKEAETAEHLNWRCESLCEARKKADATLARIDSNKLPTAVKLGVAPAMNADPRHPFWGIADGEEFDWENYTKEEAKLFGCYLGTLPPECRRAIEATSGTCTTRA